MLRSILPELAVTVLLVVALTSSVSRAADPALKNAVNVLLNKGWAKTAEAKGLAAHATLDRPPLSADSSVLEARWLVLMYQGQYAPAMDTLKRHLEKSPTSLDGLRAEVWMCMVLQEHAKALAAAQKLADVALPAQPGGDKGPAASAASDELIQLLGRVAGFLQGPANKANDPARQKFAAQLITRLSPEQKRQFDEAKQDVLTRYQDMLKEAADANKEKQDGAEADKDKKLERLKEESERIMKEKDKVEQDKKQVESDLKTKTTNLKQQIGRLERDWNPLKNLDTQIRTNIQNQQNEIQRLENQGRAPKANQPLIQNQIQQARTQLNNLNQQLGANQAKMTQLDGTRQGLLQQGQQIEGAARIDIQKLADRLRELDQERKKNDTERRRAEGAKAGSAAKAVALQSEARAFSTYEDFPFENLRAKLLALVR